MSHINHPDAAVAALGGQIGENCLYKGIKSIVADQHETCTAVHAYAVDRTVPVIGIHGGFR
jgi:hypothetical protein